MTYQQIEPARAKARDWSFATTAFDDDQWFVEPKLDGWRFLMHLNLDRTYLTGRHVSKRTGTFSEKGLCAPHLTIKTKHKGYTVLDGEVMPPIGATFRDLAGIMNVTPDKAKQRIEEIGPPWYHAFDILFHGGVDIRQYPLNDRRLLLDRIAPAPYIKLVPQYFIRKEIVYNNIIADGGEGVILKNIHSCYGATNHYSWVKIKRVHTLDTIVTGFTDAEYGKTGKFAGLIGAIKVSVYKDDQLVEVGNVSGMDDATRTLITQHKKKWLNQVIEIRAQELAKDRLRHPRFVRIRPDASPRNCTYSKMLADLKAAR